MKKIFDLNTLFSPSDSDAFLNEYWPEQPFCVHHQQETLNHFKRFPFLNSLESLLKHWPYPVSVHLPDARDECSAIETTTENAYPLFKNKMALLFNQVERLSPELVESIQKIKSDLGLPKSTFGRCIVYATPDGKGTAPHFDQNINFVLQIHGTKKWWLEKNVTLKNPTERFTMNQPLDPELQSYLEENQLPTELSSQKEEIILQPGSILFVPRGYWHSTESEGDSLALNFTFSQPSFADLFLLALRSRLLQSTEWRELANGVQSKNEEIRNLAEEKFQVLIQELIEDLPHWNAKDILGATEGDFS